jgi:hypothetical protein
MWREVVPKKRCKLDRHHLQTMSLFLSNFEHIVGHVHGNKNRYSKAPSRPCSNASRVSEFKGPHNKIWQKHWVFHVLNSLRIDCSVLTVNFGTPNMFITLWFELDYGTNLPLGTLMIWQFQLCMCVWKCCAFARKCGLKDGVITSSKEQMRSLIRVQVQGEITPKGGKDQDVTT